MTARSKFTLVEAGQIKSELVGLVRTTFDNQEAASRIVDVLIASGVIDPDAVFRQALLHYED